MHSRVIEKRILNGTSSENATEAASSDKFLDQSIYDENLRIIKDDLSVQTEVVQDIKAKIASDADLEKRKQDIATQSAHLQAGAGLIYRRNRWS